MKLINSQIQWHNNSFRVNYMINKHVLDDTYFIMGAGFMSQHSVTITEHASLGVSATKDFSTCARE